MIFSPVEVEQVRALTADLDPENYLFSDAQLQGFITLYQGSIKRAAARALRTVAASEVLVGKKIRTQDLQTDGPAVAAELRALAREWDAKADALEVVDEGFIGYIPGPGAVTGRYEGEEGRAWWG